MRTSSLLSSRQGFTLVELLVGMTIFAVGMTAILAMLHSAINSSIRSREEIVAANLLREQVELVKNMRNTNIRSFAPWDRVVGSPDTTAFTGGVFIIENNYASDSATYTIPESSPVSLRRVTLLPTDSDSTKFTAARLYLDNKGRFTHDSTVPNTETKYASYLNMSPLEFSLHPRGHMHPDHFAVRPGIPLPDGKYQGYILDARVIAKSGGQYRVYDLKTVITDWQK